MMPRQQHVVVVAGPNGAGKSTSAPYLLRGRLGVTEFVNADVIARGLSGFAPEAVAIEAGRIMLARMKTLQQRGVSFAFETTLASRQVAARIATWVDAGYECDLVFLWLPSLEIAVARVAERVRAGGHDVPEETIRRRYERGLMNFFHLRKAGLTAWRLYDSAGLKPRLVARGSLRQETVLDRHVWQCLAERYDG